MQTRLQLPVLFSILFLCNTTIQANIAHTIPEKLTPNNYAAPCEDISPQSQLLINFQKALLKSPNNTLTLQNNFWQNIQKQGTPIIEPINKTTSRLIFLWKDAQYNVRLIGGPSNDHEWLTRIKNTNIWFKEIIINNQYIGSYSFAVDVPNIDGYLSHYCPQLSPELKESRAQRRSIIDVKTIDPFNKRRWLALEDTSTDLRNENIVALAQAPQYIDPQAYPEYPQPQIKQYSLKSQLLKNQRNIYIYQSKAKPNQSYITALFFDGEEYNHLLNVSKALDILVSQEKLSPIQVVFISHPNKSERTKELTPNAEYSQFFSQELLPWIDQHLPNPRNQHKTVLVGSSLGGLSAAYLALENPQEISHIIPLSGSFWWQKDPTDLPNGMSQIIRNQPHPKPQFWYISANSLETSRNSNDLSILGSSPIVAEDLKSKGHHVIYKEYVGGHSYAVWQVVLQNALIEFFSPSSH